MRMTIYFFLAVTVALIYGIQIGKHRIKDEVKKAKIVAANEVDQKCRDKMRMYFNINEE